jgi:hypothetical protein
VTGEDDDLRAVLEWLDPLTRDAPRRVLIRDQVDSDAVTSQLLRYRDGHGDEWADSTPSWASRATATRLRRVVAAEEVAGEPARLVTRRASCITVALITTATAKEATGLTSRSLVSPTALSVQILTASTGTTTGSAASSREQLGIGCLAFANCVSLVTGADSDE